MSATNSYAEEAAQRWPVEYVESNLKLKSMSKEDQQKLFKLGCDNITNYIDAANLPNLPGRTFYATIKYQIFHK